MRYDSVEQMRDEQWRLIRLLDELDAWREHGAPFGMHDMRVDVTVNLSGCDPVEVSFSMHEVETGAARKLGLLTAEIMRSEGRSERR